MSISLISKSAPPFSTSLLFFKEYFNYQVRINKMVNKHTIDYHPYLFPEYILNFFSNSISHYSLGSFKSIVLRLLENSFASQKTESVHFYSFPQAKLSPRFLSSPPRQKEITHFPKVVFFENLVSSKLKGGEGKKL